jgi:ComF family protein
MDIFNFSDISRCILDFFLPRTCIICEAVLYDDEKLLCGKCAGDVPHTYFWLLRNNPMADKFNGLIQEKLVSALDEGTATGWGERYVYAAALFFYRADSEYRKITQAIKYHGRSDVGQAFGRMLGERLRSSSLFADVDVVIPIPLHWTRQWKRGYNQAEVIASGVADAMSIPLRSDILRRHKRTKTQTRLGIGEKARNVKGAFSTTHHWLPSDEAGPEFRHLLLIDDVFTTGSTLMACFTALREVFPPSVRISVATLAFVGRA